MSSSHALAQCSMFCDKQSCRKHHPASFAAESKLSIGDSAAYMSRPPVWQKQSATATSVAHTRKKQLFSHSGLFWPENPGGCGEGGRTSGSVAEPDMQGTSRSGMTSRPAARTAIHWHHAQHLSVGPAVQSGASSVAMLLAHPQRQQARKLAIGAVLDTLCTGYIAAGHVCQCPSLQIECHDRYGSASHTSFWWSFVL